MATEQLKNGSTHDSYAVDDVLRNIDAVKEDWSTRTSLLLALKRLATTEHPDADKVTDAEKRKLQEAGLLDANGTVSQIIRDVVESAVTELENNGGMIYKQPYAQERTPAERAGKNSSDPLAAMLNKLSIKQNPGGRGNAK